MPGALKVHVFEQEAVLAETFDGPVELGREIRGQDATQLYSWLHLAGIPTMKDQPKPNPEAAVGREPSGETPPLHADEFPTRAPPVGDGVEQANRLRHGDPGTAAGWQEGLPAALPLRFGRYTLHKLLGKGGMGAVYLAHDAQLDRQVALKLPCFGANPHPDVAERFLREARAAATISHPNVCQVHDFGEIDRILYLTMQYIEGHPLSEVIRHEGLPIRDSVQLIVDVAQAMQEAHRRGIIHRDLKPANIMIDLGGKPVIMDFGLARRGPETSDVRLTQRGAQLGTPAYMPPEQVDGIVNAMGPPCDIYSLGVILYEMLTGRLPFLGPSVYALMAQIMTVPPPPPSQFRPEVDGYLEALCLKALAKQSDKRFASMKEFAEELASYLHRITPSANNDAQVLEIARSIQASFLPEKLPEVVGWDVRAYFRPARNVGGNFYDVFALPRNHVALVIADVCDFGVGAAVFMTLFRTLLRAFAQQNFVRGRFGWTEPPVATVPSAVSYRHAILMAETLAQSTVEMTNQYVAENHSLACMFATVFFGVLDTTCGVLTYVNAGNDAPALVGPSGVKERLYHTGPAVGLFPNAAFNVNRVVMEPRDVLMAYTDGVTEACDSKGRFFTEQRLLSILGPPVASAAGLLDRVVARLDQHLAGAEQRDDVTLLAVGRGAG